MNNAFFPTFRPDKWMDTWQVRNLRGFSRPMEPEPRSREGDGLPSPSPDRYWSDRFDLMLDAEDALRSFLALLVSYHQTRLPEAFLLGFCDVFELTLNKGHNRQPGFRFRVDVSDGISFEYSTHHAGCLIWVDGKQDSLHCLDIGALDDLRQMIAELLPAILQHPIWDTVKQSDDTVTLLRRSLI